MPSFRPKHARASHAAAAAVFIVTSLAAGSTAATPAAFTFPPPNLGWTPVTLGGVPIGDPEGDSPGARDIVGDTANPMLYVASDADHIYFRLRLDSDPRQSATNFGPFGWGCFVNTDADPTSYEYSTVIDGVNNPDRIRFFHNTVTLTPNDPNDSPEVTASSVLSPLDGATGHAIVESAPSSFGGTADYFVVWAVDMSAAQGAGYTPGVSARFYCGSSNNGTNVDADCSGGAASGCLLSSQFSDPVACGPSGCGVCGDGFVGGLEGCDDGNGMAGDGCSPTCMRELGQSCSASAQCGSGACDGPTSTCVCDGDSDCSAGQTCVLAVSPPTCMSSGCGNGVLEAGEGCDDGNTSAGDGCSAACLIELNEACSTSSACESGYCDPSSVACSCNDDSDCTGGDLCNDNAAPHVCVAPGCANGVLESGEGCDDGNLIDGDGCTGTCFLELGATCGSDAACESGACDPAGNICSCDDDLDCPSGQLCNLGAAPTVCLAPGCGNGVVDAGEGCDDGNTTQGDGCGSTCLRELGQTCGTDTSCESAYCQASTNTCACNNDSDCPSGDLCTFPASPAACVAPGCGNNILEAGEGCDDDDTLGGDGCNAGCLVELGGACSAGAECESGQCDATTHACTCNDDADCSAGQLCDTGASPATCVAPGCGNGLVEAGEGCDDGNPIAGDGCGSACLRELGIACTSAVSCESGYCDPSTDTCACNGDTDCPSGQLCTFPASPAACVPPGCGNTLLEAGEGCDDGDTNGGDGCNAGCLVELGWACSAGAQCASAQCDGNIHACTCNEDADCPAGRLCDTGASPTICVNPGCGNWVLEPGESCEDGNTSDGDGCSSACLRELAEACNTGSQCVSGYCEASTDTCACDDDADCSLGELCTFPATAAACVQPGCGNTVIEPGEGCDDGNAGAGDGCDATCLLELGEDCSVGAQCESGQCDVTTRVCTCNDDGDCAAGQLCNAAASPTVCVAPGCGNGLLDASEGCDDGNAVAGDGCGSTCLRELGEACSDDGSCESAHCEASTNTCACNNDGDCPTGELCTFPASPAVCALPGCGNAVVEPAEGCDDGNTSAGDGCGGACLRELGEECSADDLCESGRCDAATHTCTCDDDADCHEGQLCNSGVSPSICVAPGCGNGLIDTGEGCDDGNASWGDGCGGTCLRELGEACGEDDSCESTYCEPSTDVCACNNDGDCPSGDLCTFPASPAACVQPGCGNAVVEPSEGCDDGNTGDGDGCNGACLIELRGDCSADDQCASGHCDGTLHECSCDDDGDCATGQLCNSAAAASICVAPGCGNGLLEIGEGCDDGNARAGDGCGSTCLRELGRGCTESAACESAYCELSTDMCSCNDDSDCPSGDLCTFPASPAICVQPGCGNSVVEQGEGCDDGNTNDGDGCDAGCFVELGGDCSTSVACASDACAPNLHQCVQCTKDEHCSQETCDQSTWTCVPASGTPVIPPTPNAPEEEASPEADEEGGWALAGGGMRCSASATAAEGDAPAKLLGLLGLALLGARRRRGHRG